MGVRHFIIQGVEELSWEGTLEQQLPQGPSYAAGAPWKVRELLQCFFLEGVTMSHTFWHRKPPFVHLFCESDLSLFAPRPTEALVSPCV